MIDEPYWLCCGDRNPMHNNRCMEAQAGHPEYCLYGTADEHSKRAIASLQAENDARWCAMFKRRVKIENLMFDAANGKRPMPDKDELRAWALELGTP